ncbi:peptidylprolyl isomerase [candidate division KSB1 bacterium]|nr:peptidylprolyl isomerase [candidate division KSB1 bacterium]
MQCKFKVFILIVVSIVSIHTISCSNQNNFIHVVIQTELGDIEVAIDSVNAPNTSVNFLKYVDEGFYSTGSFYRTVKLDNQPDNDVWIEVIQGGINREYRDKQFPPINLERTNQTHVNHEDGAISMARSGPDTATSAFFICIGNQPSLDFGGDRNPDGQGFAAFGKVTHGMKIIRNIQSSPAEGQGLTPAIKIINIKRK